MTDSTSGVTKPPKVSVVLLAYNHAPYMAQAIESVLMQQTNFAYELLIGEDDSADGTREIVLEYAKRFPEIIQPVLHSRLEVMYIEGRPTGRWNYYDTIRRARGDYVAYLDGDDYWTSPHKLQRQADLLDRHPDLGLCFHAIHTEYEQEGGRLQLLYPPGRRTRYTLEDLLQANFIAHVSVMYRHLIFNEMPAILKRAPAADYPIHIMHAQQGDIGYIDEAMAVRRATGQGMYSSLRQVTRHENHLKMMDLLNESLDYRYDSIVQASKEFTRFRIFLSQGKRGKAVQSLWRCLRLHPRHIGVRWLGWRNIVGETMLLRWYVDAKQRIHMRRSQQQRTEQRPEAAAPHVQAPTAKTPNDKTSERM